MVKLFWDSMLGTLFVVLEPIKNHLFRSLFGWDESFSLMFWLNIWPWAQMLTQFDRMFVGQVEPLFFKF